MSVDRFLLETESLLLDLGNEHTTPPLAYQHNPSTSLPGRSHSSDMVKRRAAVLPLAARKRRAISTSSESSSDSNSSTSSRESEQSHSSDSASGSSANFVSFDTAGSDPQSSTSEDDIENSQIEQSTSGEESPNTLSMGGGATARANSIPAHLHIDKQSGLPSPSIREPSHDGTIVMPSVWDILQRSSAGSLVPYQSADCFPVFTGGDVIIKTERSSCQRTFQLHSSVLSRHSPWFAHAFRAPETNDSPQKWHSFKLEEANGKVVLVRHNADGERPHVSHRQQPEIINGVHIKVEDASDEASMAPSSISTDATIATRTVNTNFNATVASYTQVFGSFYSIPPRVSTIDVSEALVQSEELIKIAAELGSLHLLRSHLGNTFSQYRQKLFLAIKCDPARWIQLAIALEDRSIYTECLVHIVGAHPRWPWPTPRIMLPEYLQHLINKRSQELGQMRTEIERDLLLSTIPYGRNGRALNPVNKGETETWTLVQIVRDQIAQRINALDRTKDAPLQRGTLFRGIRKGTLRQLDKEHIRGVCWGTMPSAWRELGEDLERLKKYAADVVEDLAVNELMIDPDANDVGYLTCVKVKDEDIPWLASAQQAA